MDSRSKRTIRPVDNNTMVPLKFRSFDAFTVLVFHSVVILILTHSCGGQSEVSGPDGPIVALVGDDIILPCYLKPVMNAYDMTVEWARPDPNPSPRFVFVWRDGVELHGKKHPSYGGRTSLFTDELQNGNISLKLSSVNLSDQGSYRCFVPELDRHADVRLVVGAVASDVRITESNRTSSRVVLQCESAGWYPEPEVFWVDGEGNLLSAGPTETLRGSDGLYNVSSRVTVEKGGSSNFTCRVQQKNTNQSRETHIHVPETSVRDNGLTNESTGSGSSSAAPIIIGLVLSILIVAVVVFVWKRRRNIQKNKKKHEDEETQRRSNSEGNGQITDSLMERESVENVSCEREKLMKTQEETHQLDTNDVLIPPQGQTETQPVNKGAEHLSPAEVDAKIDELSAEREINDGVDMYQEETETEPNNEDRTVNLTGNTDMQRETHQEQIEEERNTENNQQTGGRKERENSTDGVTGGQSLKSEEEHHELNKEEEKLQTNLVERQREETETEPNNEDRPTERETEKNEEDRTEKHHELNKEEEKLQRILQAKERDEKRYQERLCRSLGLKESNEKKIKELKLQLEEVESQREKTERKLQSKDREEDLMKTETPREAAEKEEAVRLLSDTQKDLEKKKTELVKQLENLQKAQEKIEKDVNLFTEKKSKAAKEKEEIIRKLEER